LSPFCFLCVSFFSFSFWSPWHWHLIWTFGSFGRFVRPRAFLLTFIRCPQLLWFCSNPSSTQKVVAGRLTHTPLKGSVLLKCLCTYKCFCPHTEVLLCVVWGCQDTFNVIFHMANRKHAIFYEIWVYCDFLVFVISILYFNNIY
jgi:hypothetical protein